MRQELLPRKMYTESTNSTFEGLATLESTLSDSCFLLSSKLHAGVTKNGVYSTTQSHLRVTPSALVASNSKSHAIAYSRRERFIQKSVWDLTSPAAQYVWTSEVADRMLNLLHHSLRAEIYRVYNLARQTNGFRPLRDPGHPPHPSRTHCRQLTQETPSVAQPRDSCLKFDSMQADPRTLLTHNEIFRHIVTRFSSPSKAGRPSPVYGLQFYWKDGKGNDPSTELQLMLDVRWNQTCTGVVPKLGYRTLWESQNFI